MIVSGIISREVIRKELENKDEPNTCEECEYFYECLNGKRRTCVFR